MTKLISSFQGKRRTPRFAARDFCRWCFAGNPYACPSSSCPLFAYRLTKPTPEAQESALRAIHAFCLGCARSAEAVRTCTAHKPFSETQPECPLWPHRDGKRHVSAEYRAERREQAKKQRREPGPGATFAPEKAVKGHGLGEGSPERSSSVSRAESGTATGGAA
jgi:hypothetical protein